MWVSKAMFGWSKKVDGKKVKGKIVKGRNKSRKWDDFISI